MGNPNDDGDWVTIHTPQPAPDLSSSTPTATGDWQTIAPVGGAITAVGPNKYQQAALEDQQKMLAAGLTNEGYNRRAALAPALGWGDDVMAGLRTPIEMFRHGLTPLSEITNDSQGYGLYGLGRALREGYRYARAQEDLANQNTAENTHGPLGIATDLAGGGVGVGGVLGAGTRYAKPAVNYGVNLLKATGLGTVLGLGEAPTAEQMPQSGAMGALTGLAGGAILPPLASAVGQHVIRPLMQPLRRTATGVSNVVDEYLTRLMNNARRTPDQLLDQVREARMSGQPFTLADALGREGERGLAAMSKQPGAQRDLITDAMSRNLDRPYRVGAEVGESLNAPTTAQAAAEALKQRAVAESTPYYQRAWRDVVPPDQPGLAEALAQPEIKQGLRAGVQLHRREAFNRGEPYDPFDLGIVGFDEAGDPIMAATPNMRTLHTAKRGLDTMEEAAMREGPYGREPTTESRSIGGMTDRLLGIMDEISPNYAQARSIYAGDMSIRDAVQQGRIAASTGRYEDTIRKFNAMTPTQQEGFRIGYADATRAPMEKSGNFPGLYREKSAKGREELQAFATPDRADPLRRYLNREEQMLRTEHAAMGGSSTFENAADVAAAPGHLPEALNLGQALLSGSPAHAARGVLSFLGRVRTGNIEPHRVAITEALLNQNPDTIAALAQRIAEYDKRRRGVNPWVNRPPRYAPMNPPPPAPPRQRIEPTF